jgi:hypothetical protein
MKVFNVLFEKKNGEMRRMRFVKLENLPVEFLNSKLPNRDNPRAMRLPEGSELVWDIEKNGFRIINWRTVFEQEERELNDVRLI